MKKGIILFSVSLISTFIFYLLIISVPNNAVSLNNPFFKNKNLNFILPEGWAFFTRSPREEKIYVYKIKNGILKEVSLKNTNLNQLFGINRRNRLIQDKLGKIISKINIEYWYQGLTDWTYNKNILDSLNYIAITIEKPSLCGNYIIMKKKPLPWAYFKSKISNSIIQSCDLIRIKFKCKRQN